MDYGIAVSGAAIMRSLGFGRGEQFWARLTPSSAVSGAHLGSDHVFLIVEIPTLGRPHHMAQPPVASDPGQV